MKITNKRDVKLAYELINLVNERKAEIKDADTIAVCDERVVELKRDLRKYFHRPVSKRRVIQNDSDGYIELFPLPEGLESLEDAREWFENMEYLEYRPSLYDCTGQLFTSWYKVFPRRGGFYVYHRVSIDV